MEARLNKWIDDTNESIKTTSKNFQAQLAQHRKDVNQDFKDVLANWKT